MLCVAGHVKSLAFMEGPLGMNMKKSSMRRPAAFPTAKKLKAVIPGGQLCRDERERNRHPMDYDSVAKADSSSVPAACRHGRRHPQCGNRAASCISAHESCGLVHPLREGTLDAPGCLDRFHAGYGSAKDRSRRRPRQKYDRPPFCRLATRPTAPLSIVQKWQRS